MIQNSQNVKINLEKIPSLAKRLKDCVLPPWDNTLQYSGDAEQTALYYFFLDSINFCFWAEKGNERWSFQKDGEWLRGYYAYSYAIKKSFEQNPNYFKTGYIESLSFAEFAKIFEGKNELLLLKERHEIICENFKILNKNFDGKIKNLILGAEEDVNKLVEILISTFPSFQDLVVQDNKKIYFLKRAQIFVSDLYYAFEDKGLGHFHNMEDLAVFADYKLPQLLQAEGVLEYSAELENKIQNEELIAAGSTEEIEIRSTTIYACELLIDELKNLGRNLTSNQFDWILWVQAKQTNFILPHHKTVTINY